MLISVIVPTKKIGQGIRKELIPALAKQSFKEFELIIIADRAKAKEKLPSWVKVIASWPKIGPADKRDLGVKRAKGKVVAFIDADAYPAKDWLKKAVDYFKNKRVAAVCGPGVTPSNDNLLQQVSGWVWQSWLGAGGAGIYRCSPGKKRTVDDYPSFNLIVRKKDFNQVGGFNSQFWPGEDTQLCYQLVYKLKKEIVYDPGILVYHHRRAIFSPHLKQVSRFGLHRGFFVKILPQTSRRLGYFVPLAFALWFFVGWFLWPELYFLSFLVYWFLLVATGFWATEKSRDRRVGILIMPAIFLTHLVYGIMFARGLLARDLKQFF